MARGKGRGECVDADRGPNVLAKKASVKKASVKKAQPRVCSLRESIEERRKRTAEIIARLKREYPGAKCR